MVTTDLWTFKVALCFFAVEVGGAPPVAAWADGNRRASASPVTAWADGNRRASASPVAPWGDGNRRARASRRDPLPSKSLRAAIL